MTKRVHRDESTGFQVRCSGPNCAEHEIADGCGQNVLRPDLNDARFVRPQSRQQCTEIQVVGENDPAVGRSEIEDLGIRRPWPTDC